MEKQIEILKNWVKNSGEFFDDKYGKIMAHEGRKTNKEMIEYNAAMTVFNCLEYWNKRLKKMIGGKEMPARILKKIENLPDMKTTSPNLLMR